MQMNPNVAAVAASFTIWFQGESVLAQGHLPRRISAGRQTETANRFSQLGFCRRPAHSERTERGTGKLFLNSTTFMWRLVISRLIRLESFRKALSL